MQKVLFTVSLANGETIAEGKGNFQVIEGALSPWQRLCEYLVEKQTTITSLSLYTADGRRFNLPSAGKNPKFHALHSAPVPTDFRFFRKAAADIEPSGTAKSEFNDLYAVIEARYESGVVLQTWVCEADPSKSWSFILYE